MLCWGYFIFEKINKQKIQNGGLWINNVSLYFEFHLNGHVIVLYLRVMALFLFKNKAWICTKSSPDRVLPFLNEPLS